MIDASVISGQSDSLSRRLASRVAILTMTAMETKLTDENGRQLDADGWPVRPKAFTLRGFGIVLLVLAFASGMALTIVTSRQMPSQRTGEFWGTDVSGWIRVGSPVELQRPPSSKASAELERYHEGWLDLTELRDIGYFRRMFLDDNHFQWDAEYVPATGNADAEQWLNVRFCHDKTSSDGPVISIHRTEGWVGLRGEEPRIKMVDQVRRRIVNRLELIGKI